MDFSPIPPPDSFESSRIGGLGEQNQGSPEEEGGNEKPPNKGLALYLLNILKKTVTFFLRSLSEKKRTPVKDHLLELKQSLDVLKKEDRSEDSQFLGSLSLRWQALLEDALSFDLPLLKTLIKKIQYYPEHQEHSFGYYLTEYAGQKWIPFPYMEMIEKIHSDHLKNPSDSALNEWTALIDELLIERE